MTALRALLSPGVRTRFGHFARPNDCAVPPQGQVYPPSITMSEPVM
jgi:hypothetical protein